MSAILIDYSKILEKKHPLFSLLSPPPSPSRGFYPGLIIITENEIFRKLSDLKPGSERVNFIKSTEFTESIISHYYVMYNQKRGICILETDCENYLPSILTALFTGLPPDTLLWVGIEIFGAEFTDILDTFITNGFNSPYVSLISPMFNDINPSVSLCRQNIPSDPNISKATFNKVMYAIQQYEKDGKSCYLYAKFSKRAIGFLKEASKMGVTITNGKESQKEITGELYVKDVKQEGGKFVYIIDIDTRSVESGEEENVNVSATRYNFHSHPHEAYVRHSVDKAWPSVTDYLGYHQLGVNTIFHCVATVEGLYVMSFSSYWGSRLGKVSRKFIDKNFEIDHKEPLTPQEYVKKINSILFKGHPIFEVKFFIWDRCDSVFGVFFPEIGSSCLPTQKIVEKYNRLQVEGTKKKR
jgi:hypothetical protein